MNKDKKIQVVYKPISPKNREQVKDIEKRMQEAYNALFELVLKEDKK